MDNDLTKGAFKQLEEEQVIKIIAWFRTKDEFKKVNLIFTPNSISGKM